MLPKKANTEPTRSMRASDKNLLANIAKLAQSNLEQVVNASLDAADDILFNESEKPENIKNQASFLATMGDLKKRRQALLSLYQQSLQSAFSEILSPYEPSAGPERGGAAVELSLVADAELELDMATSAIVNKAQRQSEATLSALNARFACAAGQSALLHSENDNSAALEHCNPLSPSRLSQFFVELVESLASDLPVKLILFKIYERKLLERLPATYDSVNALFLRAGVLKEYVPQCLAKEEVSGFKDKEEQLAEASQELSAAPDTAELANFGAAMQSAIGIAAAADAAGVSPVSHFFSGQLTPQSLQSLNMPVGEIQAINEIAQLLQYLPNVGQLPGRQSSGMQSLGTAIDSISASERPTIGYDVLLHMLDKMQRQQPSGSAAIEPSAAGQAGEQAPSAVLNNIAEQIEAEGDSVDSSIGHSERDTIGLVSMLFQFVIDDRVASRVLQRTLGRLQLPIIKVALKDPRFFSSSEHPARRLLNNITSAAVGWTEHDDYHSDPFYIKISEFIDYLIDGFDDDLGIFDEVSTELSEFLAKEESRARKSQERMLDIERGRDRTEQARAETLALIETKTAQCNDAFVNEMLRDHWANYLLRLYLQDGPDSPAYREASDVIDAMFWSISANRTASDSERLLERIPNILTVLRKGFETLGMEVNRARDFFRQLAARHKALMAPVKAAAEVSSAVAPETASLASSSSVATALSGDMCSAAAADIGIDIDSSESTQLPSAAGQGSSQESAEHCEHDENDQRSLNASADAEAAPLVASKRGAVDATIAASTQLANDAEESLGDNASELAAAVEQTTVEQELESASTPIQSTPAAIDELVAESCEQYESERDPFVEQAENLPVGQWVEVVEDSEDRLRCRLAAILRASGKRIFVNRRGVKAIDMLIEEIAEKLREESLVLLDDGQLFDKALSSIIGDLRKQKRETLAC